MKLYPVLNVVLSSLLMVACGSEEADVETEAVYIDTAGPNRSVGALAAQAGLVFRLESLRDDKIAGDSLPIEIQTQNAGEGTWSVYASPNRGSLEGSRLIAKDLPLTQSSTDWKTKELEPGVYFVHALVKALGEVYVFHSSGTVVVPDPADNNSTPFVKIEGPEIGRYTADGDSVMFRFDGIDLDGDEVTYGIDLRTPDSDDWISVVKGLDPTTEYEWTPTVAQDLYEVRVTVSDGKAEGVSRTDGVIGIGSLSFADDIKPILDAKCVACHGPDRTERRLRLDSYDRLPDPDDPNEELHSARSRSGRVIDRIQRVGNGKMPPEGETQLTPREIRLIRQWTFRAQGGNNSTRTLP